jgi:acyl-CoA synthetase (AMP-forming)/AMP-acid ligase II
MMVQRERARAEPLPGTGGTDLTLPALVRHRASRSPLRDALAVIRPDGTASRSMLFDAVVDRAAQLAAGLAAQRFLAGEPVALRLSNSLETVPVILSLLEAGAIVAPIPTAFSNEGALRALVNLAPAALVGEEDPESGWSAQELIAVAAGLPSVRLVAAPGAVALDGIMPLDGPSGEVTRSFVSQAAIESGAPALVWIESGTRVELTHRDLVVTSLRIADEAGMECGSRLITPILIGSVSGLVGAMGPALISGATLLIDRPFDSERLLLALDRCEPTHCLLPGPVANALLEEPRMQVWLGRGGTLLALWSKPVGTAARALGTVVDLVRLSRGGVSAKRRSLAPHTAKLSLPAGAAIGAPCR